MPTQRQPSVIRAILREYHSATHTAEVEPVMGPASLVGEIPVLMSCRPDLLTTGREVAVLTWSDVGGLVLGPYGAVPDDPPNADDADKVDGIHAATTPTANKLLAMDANAKFPSHTVAGTLRTDDDVRAGRGIYAGATGTNPGDNNIVADGIVWSKTQLRTSGTNTYPKYTTLDGRKSLSDDAWTDFLYVYGGSTYQHAHGTLVITLTYGSSVDYGYVAYGERWLIALRFYDGGTVNMDAGTPVKIAASHTDSVSAGYATVAPANPSIQVVEDSGNRRFKIQAKVNAYPNGVPTIVYHAELQYQSAGTDFQRLRLVHAA